MNPYHLFKYVPLSLLRGLARSIAWIIMRMPNASLLRTIRINTLLIDPALSEAQKHTLNKQIVLNQCLSSVESIKSWAMSPQWSIDQIIDVYDKEILLEGLANPNGMIAILPHLGTWEMMNAWINQLGASTIMYKPVKGRLTNEFILQGRQRLSATLVPTDGSGVKAVFKALKQGGFSMILPDHVPEPSGGVVVPFFGIETLTSTLASKLASKTKCALVGISCIRRSDGRGFDIHCYRLDNPDLYDRNANVSTHALNQAMESIIKPHCSHYMWGYRRFKHIPELGNPYRADKQKLTTFVQMNTARNSTIQTANTQATNAKLTTDTNTNEVNNADKPSG
ncbi:lysophospholipid acyltransferase family protein [Psychrobacter sp. M13]|uniref:lysophospholipid acyltransferase family protein n=1 Tax=Psychrobacter sp. M13 TaxID=3067275 RepID=UPI00273B98FB|nr:lysophospholipid acyltransferase family protein [Psychrobacter sp. M13]WLP95685.1 lysophospholipid acyltransferase family protein [Psychrobacter sp. M13]